MLTKHRGNNASMFDYPLGVRGIRMVASDLNRRSQERPTRGGGVPHAVQHTRLVLAAVSSRFCSASFRGGAVRNSLLQTAMLPG